MTAPVSGSLQQRGLIFNNSQARRSAVKPYTLRAIFYLAHILPHDRTLLSTALATASPAQRAARCATSQKQMAIMPQQLFGKGKKKRGPRAIRTAIYPICLPLAATFIKCNKERGAIKGKGEGCGCHTDMGTHVTGFQKWSTSRSTSFITLHCI